MFEESRRRLATQRVKPGDGRPLQRFRWWQQFSATCRPVRGFESPVRLPLWLTITLGVGAVMASVERGLRLRYHWLLDGAAN